MGHNKYSYERGGKIERATQLYGPVEGIGKTISYNQKYFKTFFQIIQYKWTNLLINKVFNEVVEVDPLIDGIFNYSKIIYIKIFSNLIVNDGIMIIRLLFCKKIHGVSGDQHAHDM